ACRRRSRAGGASTALAISRRSLLFVPAQAGTPVFPSARATPGSPLARGRTKWLVRPRSYSKTKADRPLLLAGRGASPVFPSLSFPRVEGDGAPKGACSGFRRNGPDHAGRPGSAGSDASKTDASASFDAPSRYLSAFAFLGDRTSGTQSVVRFEV